MRGYHNSQSPDLEDIKRGEWKPGTYGMSLGTGLYFFSNIGSAKRNLDKHRFANGSRKFLYEVTLPDDRFLLADWIAYQEAGGDAPRDEFLFRQLEDLGVSVDERALRALVAKADNFFGVTSTWYLDVFTNLIRAGKMDLHGLNGIIARKYTSQEFHNQEPRDLVGVYYRTSLLSGSDFFLIEGDA